MKNQNQNSDLAPAREERIIRLNEIRKVKASSITPKFRPTLKAVKYIAGFIVENWDKKKALKGLFIDDLMKSDIEKTSWRDLLDILNSRIEELENAKSKKQAKEEYLKTQYEMAFVRHGKIDEEAKTVLYSHNNIQDNHVALIVDYLNKGFEVTISSWCTGRTRSSMVIEGTLAGVKKILGEENLEISKNFMGYVVKVKELPDCIRVDEKAKVVTFSDNSACGEKNGAVLANYLLKGYKVRLMSWVTGRTLCGIVVSGSLRYLKDIFGEQNLIIEDKTSGDYEEYLVAVKPSEPKEKGKRGATRKHQVGELHPSGKYVWVEYKPGKFDWKSVKGWKWGKKTESENK